MTIRGEGAEFKDPATWTDEFRRAGFAQPEESASGWLELRKRLGDGSPFVGFSGETWADAKKSADPELSWHTWTRWVECFVGDSPVLAGGAGPDESAAGLWEASREFRVGFLTLAGSSPALGELLLTLWRQFRPQEWQSGWVTQAQLSRRLSALLEPLGERAFLDAVRDFQRVELLRIAYLDCIQGVPVDQVALQLSNLADALIQACLDRALAVVAKRQGRSPPGKGFAILALGKLGGLELNYSSDVDLNFVWDDQLERIEGTDGRSTSDTHEIERFFTLVAEQVVKLVTQFTERGQLYRLDTRLRPGGSSGRLVWSARASVEYYYSVGRPWERQALIRMRPVAGDLVLAARLARDLDAFIFPASLSAEAVSQIRGLKIQMEKLAADRGYSQSHVKIGRGGIRDVEYIVQYLQLVHAASIPDLKTASTFKVLELLESKNLLRPEETDVLRRGYRFLRKVEHRIQMAHMRQTHCLPDDPRELLRLARGLGFESTEAFRSRLDEHSTAIRRAYRLLFEEATARREESQELPALLELPAEVCEAAGAEWVAPFGFKDPARAFSRLRSLADAGDERLTIDPERGKEVFSRLAPRLLREINRQPDPDRTLANFEECVRALGARSVFFQLLDESEKILQLFVEICAHSSLVIETLRAHPDVFDEVVDSLLIGYTFSRQTLTAEVERLLQESKSFERDVFKFKHLHLLLIAIRDLERMDNLSNTLLNIAELAESMLSGVLQKALREAESKLGAWSSSPPRFLVLGLGKLGGQEMSYKSDLDIVVLHSGEAVTDKGITSQEYFERLSQMMLQFCGLSDALGPLLRVDLRLRPLGSHNSLAISVDAWKQYFRGENARTWERQAFLRARRVAGDEELAGEVLDFIHKELVLGGSAGPPGEARALADIWDIRKKIEAHARPGDIKKGKGGILDVEFAVQALQLCHGKSHPEILTQNTPDGIHKLMLAGLLEASHESELLTSYQFLRWMENRVSLVGEGAYSLEGMAPGDLESLVQKIGYKSAGEEPASSIFKGELEYHRRVNRKRLLEVLKVSA